MRMYPLGCVPGILLGSLMLGSAYGQDLPSSQEILGTARSNAQKASEVSGKMNAPLPGSAGAQAGPSVSSRMHARVSEVFKQLKDNGGLEKLNWQAQPPVGVRFASVLLEPGPSPLPGFGYAALLPAGALTPTAPIGDPDKAGGFILERTGSDRRYSQYIPIPQAISLQDYPYFRKTCMPWSYGYGGTFTCPSGYMGATRFCYVQDQSGDQVDSWFEEGCGAGVNGETGYCVLYCRD